MQKIVNVWLALSLMVTFPFSVAEAQTGSASIFPKNLSSVLEAQKGGEAKESEFVTFACPVDGREFQIEAIPGDLDLQRGTASVVCPYDGTVFFPSLTRSQALDKGRLTLTTVRCPLDGREFKAEVDVEGLLSGRSGASLRCPYDGTKFRLSMLGIPEEEGGRESSEHLTTLRSKTGARSFRAAVEQGTAKELFSPFDQSRLSPSQLVLGEGQVPSGERSPFKEELKPELSRIEEMFEKGIPQGVSKGIRQFGYDIFPQSLPGGEGTALTEKRSSLQPLSSTPGLFQRFEGMWKETPGSAGTGTPSLTDISNSLPTIPVGPEYVVGPGDMLILNIWGSVQQSVPVTVDADGKIILPKVGPVYVWGLTLSETETLIKRNLQEHYANFNLSLSMGKLRTIRIFVFGEVRLPGTYYLSSQATVLHALYAAYGPTKTGSLRQIKVLRADKTEVVADLYQILTRGDNSQDIPLRANDTILVPPIGEVIGVAGNVKRPAIYETRGTVTLAQMLEMAGGPSAAGYLQRIQIERIRDHERKVVQDVELTLPEELLKKGSAFFLQDGDLISVFPITAQRHNFVSILGNVERPGDYELKEGMHVRDLIEKAGGVLPGTHMERAELARYQTDKSREIVSIDLWKLLSGNTTPDLPLKEWDVVTVYSKSQVHPPKFVEVQGAVQEPGIYELTEGMRVSDLVFRAGGLTPPAALEGTELFRKGESPQILPVDLKEALADENAKADFYLSEGDRLFIRESPKEMEAATVILSGELRYPGKYAIRRGETLSSVIRRAGGFAEDAFLPGAIFTRKALRDQQRERMRQFLEAEQTALLQEQASLGIGYDPTQRQARVGLLEYREKLVKGIDQNEFLGRMVVRLVPPEALQETAADIVLEDGDSLTIPRSPSSILVVGNVYNPIAVTYEKGKNVDYYLQKVGGLTKNGDKKRVYVIKANGEAVSQFARVRPVERGDAILVPQEFKYKTSPGLFIKDTVSFLYQIAFGAIAIAAVNN